MMPTAAAKSGGDSEGAMLTVGLTGSTGSGKGYVSEIFVKSGIPCLDTDRVCRDVYMKGQPCYNDLVAAFGAGILREVVSVIADRPTQIARVMQRDGITAETAKLRLSKQKPDSYYRSRCDYVLDNSASNAGDIWNDTRRLIGVLRRLPAARC